MGSGIGRPMTLPGTQNMSLHQVECRPVIPASSCAELRPNSTHICSQHPRCATKAPSVQITVARHLAPWRCSCTPRCASTGCWLLLVWLRPQTFTAVGFPLGVFHPRAEQLRCRWAAPVPPSAAGPTGRRDPPGPASSPGPRWLWPRCWNGRTAPRGRCARPGGRGGARASGQARNRSSPETHRMIRPEHCAIHTRRGGGDTLAWLLVLEGPMVGFG